MRKQEAQNKRSGIACKLRVILRVVGKHPLLPKACRRKRQQAGWQAHRCRRRFLRLLCTQRLGAERSAWFRCSPAHSVDSVPWRKKELPQSMGPCSGRGHCAGLRAVMRIAASPQPTSPNGEKAKALLAISGGLRYNETESYLAERA